LDQGSLFVVGRIVIIEKAVDVPFVGRYVVGRQQDSVAGEAGFDGVVRGLGFTRLGDGPGGFLGVGLVGFDLSVGCHGCSLVDNESLGNENAATANRNGLTRGV
jgi:hypothetical protein